MARPGATNVKTAASGEIDDQLFIGRTLYGFGLGQGIMDLCKRSPFRVSRLPFFVDLARRTACQTHGGMKQRMAERVRLL